MVLVNAIKRASYKGRVWVVVAIGVSAFVMVAYLASLVSAQPPLVSDIRSVVPQDKVLQVNVESRSGIELATYYLDPYDKRAVHLIHNHDEAARPYAALLVYDEVGRTELDGTTLEVYEYDRDSYDRLELKFSGLSGMDPQTVGKDIIGNTEVTVLMTRLEIPGSGEVPVRSYVDERGLVVREEIGDENGTVVSRALVDLNMENRGKLVRSDVKKLAATERARRIATLAGASYQIPVVAESFDPLTLMWVMPDSNWDYVRFEYEDREFPGRPAVAISVWNLEAVPDYPAQFLSPLADAESQDLGSVQRLAFRWKGQTAVQIQTQKEVTPVSPAEVAGNLVGIESLMQGTWDQ